MQSRMEMFYLSRKDNAAYITGVGAVFDTNAATYEAFKSAKPLGVPSGDAEFLLDYYNRRGDLADTIFLSRQGFERITGQRALSEDEYKKLDREHWEGVKAVLRPNDALSRADVNPQPNENSDSASA